MARTRRPERRDAVDERRASRLGGLDRGKGSAGSTDRSRATSPRSPGWWATSRRTTAGGAGSVSVRAKAATVCRPRSARPGSRHARLVRLTQPDGIGRWFREAHRGRVLRSARTTGLAHTGSPGHSRRMCLGPAPTKTCPGGARSPTRPGPPDIPGPIIGPGRTRRRVPVRTRRRVASALVRRMTRVLRVSRAGRAARGRPPVGLGGCPGLGGRLGPTRLVRLGGGLGGQGPVRRPRRPRQPPTIWSPCSWPHRALSHPPPATTFMNAPRPEHPASQTPRTPASPVRCPRRAAGSDGASDSPQPGRTRVGPGPRIPPQPGGRGVGRGGLRFPPQPGRTRGVRTGAWIPTQPSRTGASDSYAAGSDAESDAGGFGGSRVGPGARIPGSRVGRGWLGPWSTSHAPTRRRRAILRPPCSAARHQRRRPCPPRARDRQEEPATAWSRSGSPRHGRPRPPPVVPRHDRPARTRCRGQPSQRARSPDPRPPGQ